MIASVTNVSDLRGLTPFRASVKWMRDALESPNRKGRIPSAEGLRGLAVALVFFVHFHYLFSSHLSRASVGYLVSSIGLAIGHCGVDLFFMLSGYLIYEAVIVKRPPYFSFIRRRIKRLYPTFLVVFGIYLFACFVLPAQSKLPHSKWGAFFYIIENLVMLPGLIDMKPLVVVAWSLSYEMFFYLLLPPLVTALRMHRWPAPTRWRFLWGFGLCYITYALVVTHHEGWFGSAHAAHIRMVMFVSGMLVYETLNGGCSWTCSIWSDLPAAILFIGALILCWVVDSSTTPDLIRKSGFTGEVYRSAILFVAFQFFGLRVIGHMGILGRSLSIQPLRWLGNISYSYYLIHGMILHLIAWLAAPLLPGSYWTLLVPAAIATLVGGVMLYVFVEKPCSLTQ